MEFKLSETVEEESVHTTSVALALALMLDDHHFPMRLEEEPGLEKYAKCNYCGVSIKFKDGTSSMKTQSSICK